MKIIAKFDFIKGKVKWKYLDYKYTFLKRTFTLE